jgi:hypothetical protein
MPHVIPSTADAVAASVEVAARLGLPTEHPVVVAEGYSVRVRLDPAPVLTRVVTAGAVLRGDPEPWLAREVDVTRFLVAAGAPVVPAWADAGPHRARGLAVTLWRWVEPEADPQPITPSAYGALLGRLHDDLLGYPAELPVLVGPLTDIDSALRTSDHPVLHASAERLVPLALTWPRRPLHGDAHTGNLLSTPDGPRWLDLEDVCAGPVEWDLASRTLTDEHADAYPGDVDAERLAQCRGLRNLQVLAALLTDDVQDPTILDDVLSGLRPWA